MEVLYNVDITIFKWIHIHLKNDILDLILPMVRTKTTWIPLYLYFIYYLYKYQPKNYWKIIIGTILIISVSDIACAQILKPYFGRIRPCAIFQNELWFSQFNYCSDTFSFPSCHAMNHAALAIFIAPYFRRRYQILLVLWVLLIGYSQVYIGVHYPSDILGGICLGFLLAKVGRIVLNKLK